MTSPEKPMKEDEKSKIKKEKPSLFIRFAVTLLLMLGVFVVAAIITYIASAFSPQPSPSTYEDCLNARGSTIQESYPAVCTTTDGNRFVQPLSEDEQKLLESPLN